MKVVVQYLCHTFVNPGFFNKRAYGPSTYRIEAAQFGRLAHIYIALLHDIISVLSTVHACLSPFSPAVCELHTRE